MAKEMVLKPEFNLPKETSEVTGKDGKQYLQFNTSMATLYKQTYGEHSRFFFALKEGRLIGSKCKKCGNIMATAATWNCPLCDFAEMEEVNPEFPTTDVVLVVGANDVVNPAAHNDPSSPIYGMPILDVENAAHIIINKRSMNAGYAGIDNELFYNPKTSMLFGDAKKVLTELVKELKEM